MGVTEKLSQMANTMQNTAKSTAGAILGLSLKAISSLVLSFIISLVLQTLIGFGQFSFLFSLVIGTSLFMRLLWTWSIGATLIFDLICILVALLLRMYILLAP